MGLEYCQPVNECLVCTTHKNLQDSIIFSFLLTEKKLRGQLNKIQSDVHKRTGFSNSNNKSN